MSSSEEVGYQQLPIYKKYRDAISLARGAVLWLVGLPLRALHNVGRHPAVIVAVSRRVPDR